MIVALIILTIYLITHYNAKTKRSLAFEKERAVADGAMYGADRQEVIDALREQALSEDPKKYQVYLTESGQSVFGIVMDVNSGDQIVTLAAFINGEASIYISTGAAYLGGNKSEAISEAVRAYVQLAEGFVEKATRTHLTPLPYNAEVNFFFLQTTVRSLALIQLEDLYNESTVFCELFQSANNVMKQIDIANARKS